MSNAQLPGPKDMARYYKISFRSTLIVSSLLLLFGFIARPFIESAIIPAYALLFGGFMMLQVAYYAARRNFYEKIAVENDSGN